METDSESGSRSAVTEKAPGDTKSVTVAMPRDLANRLKVVAAYRDMTMTEALDRYFRPVIDCEYRKCLDAARTELGGEAG